MSVPSVHAWIELAAAHLLQHGVLDGAHHAPIVPVPRESARPGGRQQVQAPRVVHPVGEPAQQAAQAPQAVGFDGPEHDPHDRLERDLLHARPQLERLPDRPGGELAPRDVLHHLAVTLHALAVEGRQHQLAPEHMLGLLQQHHRARSQQGTEDRVGEAHAEHGVVGCEHRLHILRIGQYHPGPGVLHPNGEDVAKVFLTPLQEGQRAPGPRYGLQRARHRRAWRELLTVYATSQKIWYCRARHFTLGRSPWEPLSLARGIVRLGGTPNPSWEPSRLREGSPGGVGKQAPVP